MAKKSATMRVQAYVSDPKVQAALTREARQSKTSISEAASRAIARGLQRSVNADPEDRLLKLERALRDHMRSTARDMRCVLELEVQNLRALYVRLPHTTGDDDPTLQAAVDWRIERTLDAVAASLVRGGSLEKALEGAEASQLRAAE